MRNKLEWVEKSYGAFAVVRINHIDYFFDVHAESGTATCREFGDRRLAKVSSNKGADHLKDAIIEKTIKKLQDEVDRLREITGMEEEEK